MITFWLVCGVLILIALAFVIPPLWQREAQARNKESELAEANISIHKDQLVELEADLKNNIVSQEQYEQDRDEIKRRLLDDVSSENKHDSVKPAVEARGVAYAIAIALPVLAIGIYAKIGNLNTRPTQPEETQPATASSVNPGGMSRAQIAANVAALAKRLESNPDDVQGWTMLARSYGILERYDEASKAYEKATALKPRDADILSNYAFTLAMANGQNFEGRPLELIKKALQLEPENPNVLGLAGSIAFEEKNYKLAIEHWSKLLSHVPVDSELAQAVNEKLKEAKSLTGGGEAKRP